MPNDIENKMTIKRLTIIAGKSLYHHSYLLLLEQNIFEEEHLSNRLELH